VRAATLFLLALLALGLPADSAEAQQRECGRYASSDGVEVQRSKNRCLAHAFRKGGRATLVVSRGDRNGSLVTENFFRVVGTRRLELFVDVRKDRLGAQRWRRFVCRELAVRVGSLAPRQCVETPLTATGPRGGPRQLDCGRYVLRFDSSRAGLQEGSRCLLQAFQRAVPAMLLVTQPTVEGDPIATYYAVLGSQRVERLVDATRDRFGLPQWHRFICRKLSINSRGFLDFQDCRQTVLPATFPRR
jgi:hypothetical protein